MGVIVYKLNQSGDVVWQYEGILVATAPMMMCIEAYFDKADVDLGYTVFAKGDRFVEYYYADRWYNVFAVYEGRSETIKGWYCNICRPAQLGATEISYEDLALDVWVGSDGTVLVLDEDEFAALGVSAAVATACWAAVADIRALAFGMNLPR